MRLLNVAIIGQGRSGRDIHGAYFKSPANTHYRVAAVVDALEGRRERAAQEYGCPVYDDYRALFGHTDVDLVVNSTFSHLHAPVTLDLLNHGFHVICEKPFAKTYEDGCRAVLTARRNGRMLNVFQQSRFAPYFVRIKEILSSGVLGDAIQIAIRFSGFARRWDWQTCQAYAGGNVRNTGPHPLDQALDLLGFPEDVGVFSRLGRVNTAGDAEDYAKILLTAPGKPLVDVEISSCDAYSPYLYRISCRNGSLRATSDRIEYRYFDPAQAPARKQILTPLENAEGLPAYCGETLPWVEKREEITGSVFTVGVEKYYDMIYRHLAEGRPMEIDPGQVLGQLKVIDLIHAQNPLDVMEEERPL